MKGEGDGGRRAERRAVRLPESLELWLNSATTLEVRGTREQSNLRPTEVLQNAGKDEQQETTYLPTYLPYFLVAKDIVVKIFLVLTSPSSFYLERNVTQRMDGNGIFWETYV